MVGYGEKAPKEKRPQNAGMNSDPNAMFQSQDLTPSSGFGPQSESGGSAQNAALNSALSPMPGAAMSPVNPDGTISQTYSSSAGVMPNVGIRPQSYASREREDDPNEPDPNAPQPQDPPPYAPADPPPGDGWQPGMADGTTSWDDPANYGPINVQNPQTNMPDIYDYVNDWNPPTAPPASGGGGGGGGGGPIRHANGPAFDWGSFFGGFGGSNTHNFTGFNIPANDATPYAGTTFADYDAPDDSPYETAQLNALMNALANPEWGPQRVAQMKEKQKEQALMMQDQAQQDLSNRYAGAGRAASGSAIAGNRRIQQDTIGDILGSYRDVDLNAAENRNAELVANTGAMGDALTGRNSRSTGNYNTWLGGQQSTADENYRTWASKQAVQEAALRRAIAEESAKLDWDSHAVTRLQALLQMAQFMEDQRQFNEQQGFNWTSLNLGGPGG